MSPTFRLGALVCAIALSACQRAPTVPALLADARQYAARGEQRAAIIELKNALQLAPANVQARQLLGEAYLAEGDAVSAEDALRRALALGGPRTALTASIGQALLRQGKFDAVLAEFPLSADPARLVLRGEAELGRGHEAAAQDLFTRALARQAAFAPALLGLARIAAPKEPDQARALLARALAAAPDQVDCLRLLASLERAAGARARAQALDERILRLQPGRADVHVDLALLHLDGGELDAAGAELAKARQGAVGNLALFYAQALLDFRKGKFRAALEGVQQILRVAPEHQPSLLLAGAVEVQLGALDVADQHLLHYLAVHPDAAPASALLAQVRLRTNQPQAALALLEAALARHPDNADLLALAGEASLRAGQFERAARYFDQASALQPGRPLLKAGAGLARFDLGEGARAAADLEQAAGRADGGGLRTTTLLVMSYLRAGQADKAAQAVRAQQRQADSAALRNLAGAVWLARQDLAQARASFEAALALDPVFLPALENLAQLDLVQHQPDRARARYAAAQRRAPDNAALQDAQARLAIRTGRTDEALHWLDLAYRSHPDDLERGLRLVDAWLRAGRVAPAQTLAEQLRAGHPASIDAAAQLARVRGAGGDLRGMADAYGQLAALLPTDARPRVQEAQARLQAGDSEGAVRALRQALLADPRAASAHRLLVGALLGQRDLAGARAAVQAARAALPDSALGLRLAGDLALAEQQPATALEAYQRAFARAPSGAGAMVLHALLARLGRAAEGERQLAAWIAAHGEDLPARLYLANARAARHDYAGALVQFEAVLKLAPEHVVALNDMATTCQQAGDPRALALAEQAQRLAPDSPVVLDTLGSIYQDRNERARALPLLRRAVQLAPQVGGFHYHLGLALAQAGDRAGARRELDLAAAQAADAARAAQARKALAAL